MIYLNPNPLELFVTALMGVIFGSLATILLYYLVFKTKWEDQKFHERIKSMSMIRLPEIPNESFLSADSMKDSIIDKTNVFDSEIAVEFWSEKSVTKESKPLDTIVQVDKSNLVKNNSWPCNNSFKDETDSRKSLQEEKMQNIRRNSFDEDNIPIGLSIGGKKSSKI
jgi:hypothetical protein